MDAITAAILIFNADNYEQLFLKPGRLVLRTCENCFKSGACFRVCDSALYEWMSILSNHNNLFELDEPTVKEELEEMCRINKAIIDVFYGVSSNLQKTNRIQFSDDLCDDLKIDSNDIHLMYAIRRIGDIYYDRK